MICPRRSRPEARYVHTLYTLCTQNWFCFQEAHITHDEIVQCMRWKLAMGKYSQKLKDLIQMNTPRVVMNDTKKAFRYLQNKSIDNIFETSIDSQGPGEAR